MGVLVKGMKMPENCAKCICADDNARFCTVAHEYIPMLGKPAFCPLVELPEKHGRLIDSEEFKNILTLGVVTAQMLGSEENTCSDIQFMKEILDEVPTVIEVEE